MHRITFLIPLLALLIFTTSKADVPKLNLPFDGQMKLMDSNPLVLTHQDLQQLGDALLTQPSGYSVEEKRELLVKICFVLGSTRFEGYRGGRHDSDQLARKYLTLDPQMHVGQKYQLVTSFDWPPLPKTGLEQWVSDRKERAGFVTEVWSELVTELKDYNPKKPGYSMSVPVPEAQGVAVGTDPEIIAKRIQDPARREAYKREVFENEQNFYKFMESSFDATYLKQLPKIAEFNLISAYSTPPYNLPELQQLLEPIDPKNEVKQRILSRVTKAMKARIDGVEKDPFPNPKPAGQ